jgi:hypothetical protein
VISVWFPLVAAVLLAGTGIYLTFRAYGKPREWSRRWGHVLPVLRLLSVTVVLLTLFNPEIPVPWWRTERAFVVVLDATASMAIEDSIGRSRLVRATHWISADRHVVAVDGKRVRRVSPDSIAVLKLTEQGTDIGTMLARVVDATAAERIILVSDGRHNAGSDPVPSLRRLGTEISCVPASRTGEPVDLSIQSVRVPSLLLPDQEVSIPIRINGRGIVGTVQTEAKLVVDDHVADQEPVVLASDGKANVTLRYVSHTVGRFDGRVVLEPIAGERITENNTNEFTLEIRKARWITELLFTQPSWDLSFLSQSLNEDGGFDTRVVVPDLELAWSDTTDGEVDLLVLGLYGDQEPASWRSKAEALVERGGGVVLLGWPISPIWRDISPLTCGRTGREDIRLKLTEQGQNHPLLIDAAGTDDWAAPVTFPEGEVSSSARAITLAETMDGRPAVAVQPSANGYVMTWLGADWWRWRLHKGGVREPGSRRFWPRALRWLLTPGKRGRLRVHADIGNQGAAQGLMVGVEVFSRGWEPAHDGLVSLMLTRPQRTDTVTTSALISGGAGQVSFQLPGLGPGHWKLSATAFLPQGDTLYVRQDLIVPRTGAELVLTEPDLNLLERIAHETGGAICYADDSSKLDSLTNRTALMYAPKRIRFLRTPFPFLLLLGMLTAEWWLRQRRGLP